MVSGVECSRGAGLGPQRSDPHRLTCRPRTRRHSGNAYASWIGADGSTNHWEDICDASSQFCECDHNDNVWRVMEGDLTSGTYGMAAFPPASFR